MISLVSGVLPESILSAVRQKGPVPLTGLPGGSKGFWLAALQAELHVPLVIVTAEDLEAEGLSADMDAWVALLPPAERPPVIYFPELDEAMRIAALSRWTGEKRAVLFCS